MLGTACVCSYLCVELVWETCTLNFKSKLCLKSVACSQGANGTPDKKANYIGTNKQTLRAVTVQQLVKVGNV